MVTHSSQGWGLLKDGVQALANNVQVTAENPAVSAAVKVPPLKQATPAVQSVIPASAQLAPRPCVVSRPTSAQDHASYYLQVANCQPCRKFTCSIFNGKSFDKTSDW